MNIKKCNWHKPKNLGYIAWHDWAEEMTRKGFKQTQCAQCLHFFFKEEFGNPKKELK